jgi:hypothetical protein
MRSETGIVLPDLFAQILLLDFEQSFGILPFQPRDEKTEEPSN